MSYCDRVVVKRALHGGRMQEIAHKICRKCKIDKPLWDYNLCKGKRKTTCKICERAAKKDPEHKIISRNCGHMLYNPDSSTAKSSFYG